MKIKAWVYHRQYSYEDKPTYEVCPWGDWNDADRQVIGEVEIDFEVPAGFDPRPGKIKALEAEREAIRATLGAKLTDIDRKINELLAITVSE